MHVRKGTYCDETVRGLKYFIFLSTLVMTQPISTAKITLTYPLYAADFDPNNNNYLLVGGGGGEGRSGVGNKIVGEARELGATTLLTDRLVDSFACHAEPDFRGR